MSTIVVTGSSGFIGGETLLKLADKGHEVIAIDIDTPWMEVLNNSTYFHQDDFASLDSLELIKSYNPKAIIHCAGTSLVGPSVLDPRKYYDNNFVKTKKLLDYIVDQKMNTRVIFSSSASVYGDPVMTPCSELDPPLPISPYGESKWMIESMLKSYRHAYGLDYVAFRYFNACGADSQVRHGQSSHATHIIAKVLQGIRRKNDFVLNGANYPTPDGTCIRDYIHVEDIADAHILAVDQSLVPADIYNLGTGTGYSNKQIIDTALKITGQPLNVVEGSIRAGDPAILTASAEKFSTQSGWAPKYNLDQIITHAWAWYNK
jgi:UDP-glucose 4-epimerase